MFIRGNEEEGEGGKKNNNKKKCYADSPQKCRWSPALCFRSLFLSEWLSVSLLTGMPLSLWAAFSMDQAGCVNLCSLTSTLPVIPYRKLTDLHYISKGGFGTVFRAQHSDWRTTVAIKCLKLDSPVGERYELPLMCVCVKEIVFQ